MAKGFKPSTLKPFKLFYLNKQIIIDIFLTSHGGSQRLTQTGLHKATDIAQPRSTRLSHQEQVRRMHCEQMTPG